MQIQNWKTAFFRTPIFKFYLLSPNLRSSFANFFNFKFSKPCWKSPKLYKGILAHFEKMSLARWFWAFFFFSKKREKEVFCLVKWAKTNASDRQDEANKNAESFPTYRILAFEFRYPIGNLFLRGKTPFLFKKRKTLKINAPNSFFQNEPKFLYIILDFFNKVLKTWSWTSWQKKSVDLVLEDRIWRLEFGKMQFPSFEAAIWRMNFKACTFERLAF